MDPWLNSNGGRDEEERRAGRTALFAGAEKKIRIDFKLFYKKTWTWEFVGDIIKKVSPSAGWSCWCWCCSNMDCRLLYKCKTYAKSPFLLEKIVFYYLEESSSSIAEEDGEGGGGWLGMSPLLLSLGSNQEPWHVNSVTKNIKGFLSLEITLHKHFLYLPVLDWPIHTQLREETKRTKNN